MTILLLGADGQLGRMFRTALPALGPVVALGRQGADGLVGDLADAAGLAGTVRRVQPTHIVNAAAYTAVDRAEQEPGLAMAVNGTACGVLAREAEALGAWLIHYSTDYVFDGSGDRPWREDDPVAPLGVYGASKLAGERAIQAACARHLVFRTSWVFEAVGGNFIRSVLQVALGQDAIEVVDDQWGAPTRAKWLAETTAALLGGLRDDVAGLYHLAPAGVVNRHALAIHALERARNCGMPLRAGPADVRAVPTRHREGVAARPLNSRLDTSRFRAVFGQECPPWEPGVDAVVAALAQQSASVECRAR